MTAANLMLQAQIQAIIIEVEGMKAANQSWALQGGEPEYDQFAFYAKAIEITDIACRLKD